MTVFAPEAPTGQLIPWHRIGRQCRNLWGALAFTLAPPTFATQEQVPVPARERGAEGQTAFGQAPAALSPRCIPSTDPRPSLSWASVPACPLRSGLLPRAKSGGLGLHSSPHAAGPATDHQGDERRSQPLPRTFALGEADRHCATGGEIRGGSGTRIDSMAPLTIDRCRPPGPRPGVGEQQGRALRVTACPGSSSILPFPSFLGGRMDANPGQTFQAAQES